MYLSITSLTVETGIFLPMKYDRDRMNLLLAVISLRIQNSLVRFQVQRKVITLISQHFRLTILLFSKDRRWHQQSGQ